MIGSEYMKLIVGLGNPGKEYNHTRHNVGFDFLDYYFEYKKITPTWTKKVDGVYFSTVIGDEKVYFLKPHTYMNLSGNSVQKIMKYYDIPVEDILIIADDLDILLGNYKLKLSGSCGGHNGLRNIEQNIGTIEYKRLKIGISNNKEMDGKDYVLGKFSKEEQQILQNLFQELSECLDDYYQLPFTDLMSKYNRKNR